MTVKQKSKCLCFKCKGFDQSRIYNYFYTLLER